MNTTAVFDGHNDALSRLWRGGPKAIEGFRRGGDGHIDLERAAKGGFVGGFFALFVSGETRFDMGLLRHPPYNVPLPPAVSRTCARAVVDAQIDIMHELVARGDLLLCRTAGEIEAAIDDQRIAALMHLEGCEAIGPELEGLDELFEAGVRSLGPVWSRPTIFAHGVPFRFPSDGDVGSGLTEAGRRLVDGAAARGMIVDTSHLNMAGFYEIAERGLPMVATHSNAHAVSPHSRNVTDAQLRVIGETGGVVGLNFATAMLRPDGSMQPKGAFEWMLRHLDHMMALAGEDHVALGSDFDGAIMPAEIGSVAGLGALQEAMHRAGYGSHLIGKICHGNWLAAIRRIVG
ncbi:MAG: dipeptidase [Pseudomonadota bacterium]